VFTEPRASSAITVGEQIYHSGIYNVVRKGETCGLLQQGKYGKIENKLEKYDFSGNSIERSSNTSIF